MSTKLQQHDGQQSNGCLHFSCSPLRAWRRSIRYDGKVIRREYRNTRALRGAEIYDHASGGFGVITFNGRADLSVNLWNTAWNINKDYRMTRVATFDEAKRIVSVHLANSEDHPTN